MLGTGIKSKYNFAFPLYYKTEYEGCTRVDLPLPPRVKETETQPLVRMRAHAQCMLFPLFCQASLHELSGLGFILAVLTSFISLALSQLIHHINSRISLKLQILSQSSSHLKPALLLTLLGILSELSNLSFSQLPHWKANVSGLKRWLRSYECYCLAEDLGSVPSTQPPVPCSDLYKLLHGLSIHAYTQEHTQNIK